MLDPTAPLGSSPSVSEIIGTYGGNKLRIAQAIQMGLLDPTKGTLAGMEIDRIRNAATAEQKPTQTVAQQTLSPQPQPQPQGPANAGKMINPGLLAPHPMGAPPPMGMPSGPAPQMASAGLGARPPGMAAGGLASLPVPDHMFNEGSFAGGGIVSFDGGGSASIPINPYGATSINMIPQFTDLQDAYDHVNDSDPDTAAAAQNFIASVTPPKSKFEDDQSYLSRAMMGDNPYGAPRISDLKFRNPKEVLPQKPNINIAPDHYTPESSSKFKDDQSYLSRIMMGNNPYGAPSISDLKFRNPDPINTDPSIPGNVKPEINIAQDVSRSSSPIGAGVGALSRIYRSLPSMSDVMSNLSMGDINQGIVGRNTGVMLGGGNYTPLQTPNIHGAPISPTTSNPPAASTYPAGSNPYTANILTPMTASKQAGLAALLDSTSAPPSRTGNAPMGTNKTPGGLDLTASDNKAIASTGIPPDIATLATQKLDYMGASPTDTGLAEEKAQLPKQKEEDKWTALANFGFSLAASKSKYFLQGVGEAGQSTVPMIQKNLETERATQRDIDKRDFDEAMQKYNVKGSAYDTGAGLYKDAMDNVNKLAVADKEAAAKIADARIAAAATAGAYAPGSPAMINANANMGFKQISQDNALMEHAQTSMDNELKNNMGYMRLQMSNKPADQAAALKIYQDTYTRHFAGLGAKMPLGTNQQLTQQTLGQAKFLGFE